MERLIRYVIVLPLLAAGVARAAVPTSFSVQGVLRDSTGKLQSMAIKVTVNIYDARTGGNQLFGPYVQSNIPVQNGLFSVAVSDPQIAGKLAATTTGELWVELTVGSEVFPRQLVTPGIYALVSATSDRATDSSQLGGIPANGYQRVLLNPDCGVGKFIQKIDASGNVTCSSAPAAGVNGVAAAAPLSSTGGTNPTIQLTGTVSPDNGGNRFGGMFMTFMQGYTTCGSAPFSMQTCYVSNPFTGACSCPAGFKAAVGEENANTLHMYTNCLWQCYQ